MVYRILSDVFDAILIAFGEACYEMGLAKTKHDDGSPDDLYNLPEFYDVKNKYDIWKKAYQSLVKTHNEDVKYTHLGRLIHQMKDLGDISYSSTSLSVRRFTDNEMWSIQSHLERADKFYGILYYKNPVETLEEAIKRDRCHKEKAQGFREVY